MDGSLSYTQIQTHVGAIAMALLDERMSPKTYIMFPTRLVGELVLNVGALTPYLPISPEAQR